MKLNLQLDGDPTPGDPFSSIHALTKGLGVSGNALSGDVDDFVALLQPFMDDTLASIVNAELWKYTSGTFEASYVSSYAIGVVGTNTGSVNPGGQDIITFRTINGGILKLSIMESDSVVSVTDYYPFGTTRVTDIAAYVVDDASWIYARDNSYANAPLAWNPGVNERLFKKIYRL